jgi:lysophospholipid acyltransferase (LPLAT)-like uncharacterized protein
MKKVKGGQSQKAALFKVLIAPLAGLIGFLLLLLLRRSIRFVFVGYEDLFRRWKTNEGVLIAFWHNQSLFMPFVWRGRWDHAHTVVSRSADGELIAALLRFFGIRSVRGSSSRGGMEALLEIIRLSRDRSRTFVLTPDGPQGPAFRVKDGAIHLAMKTGMPLYCFSVAYTRFKMFGSWDGFLLPLPFSRAYFVCSGPLYLSKTDDPDTALLTVQELLNRTNERAMALALNKGISRSIDGPSLSGNERNAG